MRKPKSSESGAFNLRIFLAFILCSIGASLAVAALTLNVVPGTAVLLSKSGSGPLSSTSSNTSIFSPAAYVNYKSFGGEPTVTVDRYPFLSGFPTGKVVCISTSTTIPCAPASDTTYASSPNGFVFPHYSPFWKSSDLGETFRVPQHLPSQGQLVGTGGGGGDSHSVVGQISHKVFFADLPGPGCITMNISNDFGESWH